MEMKIDLLRTVILGCIPVATAKNMDKLITALKLVEDAQNAARQMSATEQARAAEQARPTKRQRKLSVVGGQRFPPGAYVASKRRVWTPCAAATYLRNVPSTRLTFNNTIK